MIVRFILAIFHVKVQTFIVPAETGTVKPMRRLPEVTTETVRHILTTFLNTVPTCAGAFYITFSDRR